MGLKEINRARELRTMLENYQRLVTKDEARRAYELLARAGMPLVGDVVELLQYVDPTCAGGDDD